MQRLDVNWDNVKSNFYSFLLRLYFHNHEQKFLFAISTRNYENWNRENDLCFLEI